MPSAFVIAPFDDTYTDYWEEVYAPALQDAGLEARRGDSIFAAGNVVGQILELIEEADLILAELTSVNANVYYELGIAHRAGKPCILLTQRPGEIPFDLRNLRHVAYSPTRPSWDDRLRDNIVKAVTETLARPTASTLPLPPAAVPAPTPAAATATTDADDGAALVDWADLVARLTMLQSSIDAQRQERLAPTDAGEGDDKLATADELRQLAVRQIGAGYPEDAIVTHLRTRGAPHIWADAVVRELKGHR